MKKALTFFSLIIASLVVIAAFITATTYTQLTVAVLLYPLLVFLISKTFPGLTQSSSPTKPILVTVVTPAVAPVVKSTEQVTKNVIDIDKRTFLKLIGGAGISLFLFSIFNKRAENLFFKSLPASGTVALEDSDGKKIDPAQKHPTDGYNISEIDDNIIAYFGFTNKDGSWFIMKEDTNTGSVRYTKANSNFPGNWSNRENLKYDYFDNTF